MGKLTVAKINEMVREVAIKEIAENGLKNFLQIEGTKFAQDFEIQTEEGKMVKTVRIDVVVPKLEDGEDAEFLANEYQMKLAEKEENAKIKAEAKAKKIARDSKRRAEKEANKSNPIIKTTIISE